MDKEQIYLENRYPGLAQFNYGEKTTPVAPSADQSSGALTPEEQAELKALKAKHVR
jgi:hypothetical protein